MADRPGAARREGLPQGRRLRANAIHEDEPFSDEVAAAVDGEIADLAEWLGLERG